MPFLFLMGLKTLCFAHEPSSHSGVGRREPSSSSAPAVFDLNIFSGERNGEHAEYSACQTSLVAKKRLSPTSSICRVAFLTAAHCVDDAFESIEIVPIGKVERACLIASIPGAYRLSALKRNERKRGDSATVIFDIPCENIGNSVPVPLAQFNPEDGTTEITGKKVFLQKRRKAEGHNVGGGKLLQADIKSTEGHNFEFEVPSPQGAAIMGGDSGGAVFNEKGQLICPLSGSSYEGKKEKGVLTLPIPDGKSEGPVDPFSVICDKRAISRLKKVLEEHQLTGTEEWIAKEVEESSKMACYKPKANPKRT